MNMSIGTNHACWKSTRFMRTGWPIGCPTGWPTGWPTGCPPPANGTTPDGAFTASGRSQALGVRPSAAGDP